MQSRSELEQQLADLSETCRDALELTPTLEKLALLCHRSEEYEAAQSYYERILEIRKASWTCAPNTLAMIETSHSLGLLHRIKGDFEQAEPHYRTALELSTNHFGAQHANTVVRRNYLSGLYFAWGKYDEAKKLLDTSLRFYEETLGKDHEVTATCLFALALVTKRSDSPLSDDYFKRSVNLMKIDITRLSMENSHDLFLALMHLSHNRFAEEKFEEAEELFRHSLLTELREIWPKHPLVTDSYQLLANLYRSFGRNEQAEYFYRNALSIREQVYGPMHEKVGASAHSLGAFLVDQERFEEAEPQLKKACDIHRHGAFRPVLANSLKAYSQVLKNLNRHSESQKYAEEAESILAKHGYSLKSSPPHFNTH